MNRRGIVFGCLLLLCALTFGSVRARAQTFRVASYNIENYLDQPTETRPHPKSPEARAAVRESIHAANPDVLALQEMGAASALRELADSLKSEGLDFPYREHISCFDTNIHLAILSRFPITARRPHTNDNYLLGGRRFRVSRGFAEVDIQVNSNYSFTLITAHLKSKRPVPEADEADERLAEAKILRGIIDARLSANPRINLVVAGDFNDTKDAAPIKTIIGRAKSKLLDTRPAERNPGNLPTPSSELRTVTWTHYYGKEDTYSRIDYILLSPGMAREWVPAESYLPALAGWGVASDHRPVMATFEASDR